MAWLCSQGQWFPMWLNRLLSVTEWQCGQQLVDRPPCPFLALPMCILGLHTGFWAVRDPQLKDI